MTEAPARPPASSDRLGSLLFLLALVVFLASRLAGITRFPIYFFCDEAVQSVQAENLLANHLRDPETHQLLPTYFRNGTAFNIGFSVYAQVLPYAMFGHTVETTRGVGVLFGLLAAAAVGLTLRDVFGLRSWWAGALVLAATPTWFLHSRTGFEVVLGVSFYAWALYFYLRYRQGMRLALLAAILSAALAFYSYNAIQPAIGVTGLLLLVLDAPYHRRRWRTVLLAIPLAALCAVPYARFVAVRPTETRRRLQEVNSTWVRRDLTTSQKLAAFANRYTLAISPAYWYRPENERDLPRHRMKGWGHIWWPTLPFAAAGVAVCLWRVRDARYRTMLVVLAAAPVGAAIAEVLVTRGMAMIVPVAVMTAMGIDAVLRGLARFVPEPAVAVGAFAALSAVPAVMAADALRHGPTWYGDYGLYGMQWGARQVFGELRERLRETPGRPIVMSPEWANGADDLAQFFLGRNAIAFASLAAIASDPSLVKADALYVVPEDEFRLFSADRKLSIRVEKTLDYPDGKPGFHFARIEATPDWRGILAAEREARRRLEPENVAVGGETWSVAHSALDMGPLSNLFDGQPGTLVRTREANPAVFEISFPEPRPVRGVSVTTESGTIALSVSRLAADGRTDELSQTWRGLPPDPTVSLEFPRAAPARRLRIAVENRDKREPTHVHVRDVRVEP